MKNSLLAVLLATLSGCIDYNEQCEGLVENPKEVIGYIGETVFLDKPNTRHASNAMGQMAADAFVAAFADSSRPADFGVINGGAIRAEGVCITRNLLKPGKMTNGLLHEILLFENLVKAVDLTGPEVIEMMRHSVARLIKEGGTINSPSGQFLQVSSQVHLEVDCSPAAGPAVTSLKIGADTLVPGSGTPNKSYRVALSAFLLGGDGYLMLAGPGSDPTRNPSQAQTSGGTDGNLTADFMRRTYNKDQASGLKLDPARIILTNCAKPPPPAG